MVKNELEDIIDWLNENYNQESENYCIFNGAKPEVIKYSEHIAISFWACGAIVCIGSILYFLQEDDGNWFTHNDECGIIGFQSCFSIGWAESFSKALNNLVEYTKEHGKPVYYSGTNILCHYTL